MVRSMTTSPAVALFHPWDGIKKCDSDRRRLAAVGPDADTQKGGVIAASDVIGDKGAVEESNEE